MAGTGIQAVTDRSVLRRVRGCTGYGCLSGGKCGRRRILEDARVGRAVRNKNLDEKQDRQKPDRVFADVEHGAVVRNSLRHTGTKKISSSRAERHGHGERQVYAGKGDKRGHPGKKAQSSKSKQEKRGNARYEKRNISVGDPARGGQKKGTADSGNAPENRNDKKYPLHKNLRSWVTLKLFGMMCGEKAGKSPNEGGRGRIIRVSPATTGNLFRLYHTFNRIATKKPPVGVTAAF